MNKPNGPEFVVKSLHSNATVTATKRIPPPGSLRLEDPQGEKPHASASNEQENPRRSKTYEQQSYSEYQVRGRVTPVSDLEIEDLTEVDQPSEAEPAESCKPSNAPYNPALNYTSIVRELSDINNATLQSIRPARNGNIYSRTTNNHNNLWMVQSIQEAKNALKFEHSCMDEIGRPISKSEDGHFPLWYKRVINGWVAADPSEENGDDMPHGMITQVQRFHHDPNEDLVTHILDSFRISKRKRRPLTPGLSASSDSSDTETDAEVSRANDVKKEKEANGENRKKIHKERKQLEIKELQKYLENVDLPGAVLAIPKMLKPILKPMLKPWTSKSESSHLKYTSEARNMISVGNKNKLSKAANHVTSNEPVFRRPMTPFRPHTHRHTVKLVKSSPTVRVRCDDVIAHIINDAK